MSLLGNILWIIIGGGLPIAVGYIGSGLTCCMTIIGIPFGIQSIKLGLLSLLPFGRDANPGPEHNSGLYLLLNVIWFCLFGIWIAVTHLFFATVCAITIVGIPFAVQHMKLVKFSLTPFGRDIT